MSTIENEQKVSLQEAQDEVKDTVVRRNLGPDAITLPQPVFVIGTYDEAGVPNAMNVAWGGQCGMKQIELNLSIKGHKTIDNLNARKAFTVAFATVDTLVAADYVGIFSGHKDLLKMKKSGLHSVKSQFVDAPVYVEFPVTVECTVRLMEDTGFGELRVVGDVANVLASEEVLDEKGKIDADKAGFICFDPAEGDYRKVGEKVGCAWHEGLKLR